MVGDAVLHSHLVMVAVEDMLVEDMLVELLEDQEEHKVEEGTMAVVVELVEDVEVLLQPSIGSLLQCNSERLNKTHGDVVDKNL